MFFGKSSNQIINKAIDQHFETKIVHHYYYFTLINN